MIDYTAKAFEANIERIFGGIHTGFPAIVVSYDKDKHTATLQPVYKYDDGESYPQIQNVPVAKFKTKIKKVKENTGDASGEGVHNHTIETEEETKEFKLFLEEGDLVFCVCSEKSIDSMASKQVHNPQSKRTFNLSDAIVICHL